MKREEILLRAYAKKISWIEAAEILGMSCRHLLRIRNKYDGEERWHDLIVLLDDATSEIYHAQLVDEESTATVMAGIRAVIEKKGVFCALYSDRASHFFQTPKDGRAGRSAGVDAGRAGLKPDI